MTLTRREVWGLGFAFLLWGSVLGIVWHPVAPLPPPAVGAQVPRSAPQVGFFLLEGVPPPTFSWPALVPFFEDVMRRGCGGRLSSTEAPLIRSFSSAPRPYPSGAEDLVGLLRRAGHRVLGTGPDPDWAGSISPWARTERDLARALDQSRWNLVAVGAHVPAEVTGALKINGVATPRARAILEEDRRLARVAGLLGSSGPVVLVYGTEGEGYRWAAAGPGIRSKVEEAIVSPQALVGTVAAILGLRPPLAGGAPSPPIVEFSARGAKARIATAWNAALQRKAQDLSRRLVLERQRDTGLVLVLLGLLTSCLLILGIRFLV
ncbi:MAG TPA: hypothetical protein ENK43_00970 [Planctomycetes bacterium]|nr:hypothetical protein [Planctomycetota bacterium]